MRAGRNTAHTRDAAFLLTFLGFSGNTRSSVCLNRTHLRADPASHAGCGRLGHNANFRRLFVGAIAGDLWTILFPGCNLVADTRRKLCEQARVLFIRSARCIPSNNRMLSDHRNSSNHRKSRFLHRVLQLRQCVLIRAISIGADQNRTGPHRPEWPKFVLPRF